MPPQSSSHNVRRRVASDTTAAMLWDIFLRIPAAVVIYKLVRDHRGNVVDWIVKEMNPSALRSFGRTQQEVVGKRASELFGPEMMRNYFSISGHLAETGESKTFDTEFAPTQRSFITTQIPLDDDHFATVSMDVTDREQVRTELKASNERFRAIFNAMPEAVFLIDTKRRILAANPAASRVFGYAPEELIGKTTERLYLSRAEFEKIGQIYYDPLSDTEMLPFEIRYRRKDASVFVAEAVRAQVRDAQGDIVGFVAIHRNITDRKEHEERIAHLNQILEARNSELEAERERWQRVVEGIADEVWIADKDGRISLVNLPAVTHLDLQGFQNKPVAEILEEVEIFTPDWQVRAPGESPLLRSLRGEICRGEEIMRHRRTGRTRYRQFSSAPTRDRSGAITGAVAIVRDVTEEKMAEEALRRADQDKNNFLAILAHELRNPLASVVARTELLRHVWAGSSGSDTAMIAESLEVISRQATNMKRLLDDLLDISRIARRKIQLDPKPVDLTWVVKQALTAANPLIEQFHHKLSVALPDEKLIVNADPLRLEQIISNLLTNAAKFTPPGGTVSVALRREGAEAILDVADTGIGIEPEKLARIFDPFVQINATPSRRQQGLGLGLAVVHNLTKLHGGAVWASSEGPGKGSLFTGAPAPPCR
jgi:PAS domain S-box-containing protein